MCIGTEMKYAGGQSWILIFHDLVQTSALAQTSKHGQGWGGAQGLEVEHIETGPDKIEPSLTSR